MIQPNRVHPWEMAWRLERWAETSPPLPVVADFAGDLKREGAKRVLDLGCGAGRHSILLGKTGFQVVALDVSETALKTLERRLETASINNVTLVKHEMWELPFVDDYFDGIVCTNVLHHGKLVEIKQAIRGVRRVMRKGSWAFIVALFTEDFRKGNGKMLERNTYVFTRGEERGIIHHFFTNQELRACFRRFKILSLEERFNSGRRGWKPCAFPSEIEKILDYRVALLDLP
jgi:ubiquinone/menaquinone biosynthesis C-methylase UbiE